MSMTTLVKSVLQWAWLCGAGLLAFGCAYTAPTAYYTLESGHRALADSDLDSVIVIESVTVPEYLDNRLVAVRRGTHRLERREFDQWAEPLEDAIARVLRDSLSRSLPKSKVALGRHLRRDTTRDFAIKIIVYGFEADQKGQVAFSGCWEITDHNRQRFAMTVPPAGDATVDHMVAGMSQAVDKLANEIVKEITRQSPADEISGKITGR